MPKIDAEVLHDGEAIANIPQHQHVVTRHGLPVHAVGEEVVPPLLICDQELVRAWRKVLTVVPPGK